VYSWLSQGVKVEFGRDFWPLTLAPMSEMTFRGLGIWDLEIMTRVGVRKLGEIDGLKRAIDNGLGPAPAAPACGPGTEGAGIRVYGYALKNSGLTVAVNRQHLHVCMKEPRVKIRISGVARAAACAA